MDTQPHTHSSSTQHGGEADLARLCLVHAVLCVAVQGPVIVPNFLGVLLNILQLVLRSIFPARSAGQPASHAGHPITYHH